MPQCRECPHDMDDHAIEVGFDHEGVTLFTCEKCSCQLEEDRVIEDADIHKMTSEIGCMQLLMTIVDQLNEIWDQNEVIILSLTFKTKDDLSEGIKLVADGLNMLNDQNQEIIRRLECIEQKLGIRG